MDEAKKFFRFDDYEERDFNGAGIKCAVGKNGKIRFMEFDEFVIISKKDFRFLLEKFDITSMFQKSAIAMLESYKQIVDERLYPFLNDYPEE